jgi:hypothetical protein
MKSAFTRSAAAVFTLVAALFFLAVPSAKATPTGPAPYGTFTFFGTGTVANNSFSWTSGSDLALAGPNPVGSGGVVTFTAATTLQPLSSPADLFTLVVNSDTLTFFLTEVDSYTSAGVGTKGSFTGIGYFTDNAFPGTHFDGSISLTNSQTGAGDQPFSASLVIGTPEPSALVLLGTGLLAMALMAGRKLRIA